MVTNLLLISLLNLLVLLTSFSLTLWLHTGDNTPGNQARYRGRAKAQSIPENSFFPRRLLGRGEVHEVNRQSKKGGVEKIREALFYRVSVSGDRIR